MKATLCRCGRHKDRCLCAGRATIAMLQAFSDETERQREAHGWKTYPMTRVAEWPPEEQEAGLACLNAAIRANGAP